MRSVCNGNALSTWISIALLTATLSAPRVVAQDPPVSAPASTATTDGKSPLRFAFEGAPWREVIKWLADESDLALHVGELPTGSFTYSDPNSFTPQEAIDRVNLFLLPQGFTLVRSGKLLSAINLGDPRSKQQLDALANLVTVEQLDQLNTHEVVKCIFPLGELTAEDAVEELAGFKLMTTPEVFPKTKQLMITDTAGKLKSVKAVLDAFQREESDNAPVVKSFALQHVNAEDVLVVARPHLGLATGEMIGIDVSLSVDVQGRNIYVTGVEDKVRLIEGLIKAIDKPKAGLSPSSGDAELRSHLVEGGNVETVYNVLQTLLAGKSVRLSMDKTAGTIVALATPEIQSEIEQTVAQLQASEADFEVIPLKTVDPSFAISLLEEMLDLPDPLLDDPDKIDPKAPKIDADPGNMRLFVHAKKPQIEQIKRIVAGLDVNHGVGDSNQIRILPLRGPQAEQALETAAKFWREPNPIILFPSNIESQPENTERVAAGESASKRRAGASRAAADTPTARYLTDNIRNPAPAIRCQLTPRGLLLQSEDTDALDRFAGHLRTVAGPSDSMPSPPVVFYLKYTKPDDAIRMLAELLDGGESAAEGEAGTLVNGRVSSAAGTFLGSLVTSRAGTTTMTAGTITVVADSRLNRLIAQGTANDIERIQNYLEIVDKDNSITSVETYGKSHVIELFHTKASEVAAVIRDAYAGRVAGGTGEARPNQANSSEQAKREAAGAKAGGEDQREGEKKAPEGKPSSQPGQTLEPKMTIAVHEPSNSLIVTAPDQLFREVEKLAKLIDSRNEQAIAVTTLTNAAGMQSLLRQALSGGTASSVSSEVASRSAAPSPPQPSQSSSSSTILLRRKTVADNRRDSKR